jgi:molybdate transport system ATP-binding protein
MIQARLRKRFPARPHAAGFALELEFAAGSGVTVLFGPGGSGKTLTLDLIAGFERPDDGRILLDGAILYDHDAGVCLAPQARHTGYVFQNGALFPHMTIRENLAFAAERRPPLERHRRVNETLEQFLLVDVAGRRPHEVSGIERQRCAIARALIGGPRLLMIDQPAHGFDALERAELGRLLRQIRGEFATPVLLVSQDLAECCELGDHMLVLREGKLAQCGTPREILDRPANVDVARLLGVFNLLPAEVRALDPGRNSSKIRLGQFDLDGPYYPGRLKGDRVTICVRPEQLTALPRSGKPGPNQIPAHLERAVERPQWVRLEFAGGIAVDVTRADYENLRGAGEWLIGFPREALRVL